MSWPVYLNFDPGSFRSGQPDPLSAVYEAQKFGGVEELYDDTEQRQIMTKKQQSGMCKHLPANYFSEELAELSGMNVGSSVSCRLRRNPSHFVYT